MSLSILHNYKYLMKTPRDILVKIDQDNYIKEEYTLFENVLSVSKETLIDKKIEHVFDLENTRKIVSALEYVRNKKIEKTVYIDLKDENDILKLV